MMKVYSNKICLAQVGASSAKEPSPEAKFCYLRGTGREMCSVTGGHRWVAVLDCLSRYEVTTSSLLCFNRFEQRLKVSDAETLCRID